MSTAVLPTRTTLLRSSRWLGVVLMVLLGCTSDPLSPAPSQVTFALEWGHAGSGDGEFSGLNAIAIDHTGRVWTADHTGPSLQVFTPDGGFAGRSSGTPPDGPWDLAIGPSGLIYCANWEGQGVSIYNTNGSFKSKWGGSGYGAANAICVDARGTVYVSWLPPYNTIGVYDANGNALPGSWNSTRGKVFNGMAVSKDNYLLATIGHRVEKYDLGGNMVTAWGDSAALYYGIAVDQHGNAYVVDAARGRVQVFDSAGEFVFSFGDPGAAEGRFTYATRIAVDSNTGKIFVTDSSRNAVLRFDGLPRLLK